MSLSVDRLGKEYPTRSEPLRVLSDISFTMQGGESLAIVGPSGSGKSTLLYILGTLERPSEGTVRIDGADAFALDARQVARFRNRSIGFVFQDHHLLPQLSVFDNVRLAALASAAVSTQLNDRAGMLLERVGLAERWDHLPGELSGGERQRAAIARALLLQPRLVLADEPTGNLDHANAMRVVELLVEMQSDAGQQLSEGEAPMLVVVTHSHDVAQRMQRRLVLADGRLVEGSAKATANQERP